MATDRVLLLLVIAAAGCGGKIEETTGLDATRGPSREPSSSLPPSRPPSSSATAAPRPDDPPPAPPAKPAPFDWIATCPPPSAAAFVADSAVADLATARSAMAGRWIGTQTNPWAPASDVAFRFDADGGYASRTLGSALGPALYYGTDDDTPIKRWRLDDVLPDGTATGEIDVAFAYGGGAYALPKWQGVIDSLAFDAARDRMRFEMWRNDGYGPVVLDLHRCP